MERKINVLEIFKGKVVPKGVKGKSSLVSFIEHVEPDMYEFSFAAGETNAIIQVDKLRPDIIFMPHDKSINSFELLKNIKQLHPTAPVFILINTMIDDEQEVINEYMASGAYKCYLPPLNIDTLVHDMYVSLNLE